MLNHSENSPAGGAQATESASFPPSRPASRRLARWLVYPASWGFILLMLFLAVSELLAPETAWAITVLALMVIYSLLEWLMPLQTRWAMTRASFFDDLKYLVTNGAAIGACSALLGVLAIRVSADMTGPASEWPYWLQFAVLALVFEGLQYGLHRFEHEGRGPLGAWMWRIHAAHHLPRKLYVLMHVAGHPINAVLVHSVLIVVPVWLMGYDQLVVTAFLMVNSMHGLISHFNMDIRLGWLNYLFIGPELHRYHHSADTSESKNYGATLTVYDLLFGSFVYRPNSHPSALGVTDPAMPRYGQWISAMLLPFRKPIDRKSTDTSASPPLPRQS